ncbi:interactor of constitutive active ROPs protein isoform X2 [Tasmannia lanceolata]|uniref:interactor of constitutive active ROPs protein isoform X2 n=1 Tax=Tasmannia lanceolata TaxID=3420 RepID=UPI004064586E
MTQSGDFHLPDEILSVIPTDPYDQLDLAKKITSMAIASRVSKLESEAGRLRQKIAEKDHVIFDLQNKVSEVEDMFRESDARLRVVLDENIKLSNERDSLAVTAKKLNRDLGKLETFKRHLMQSLSDDNSPQAETVDIGTCDQSVGKASSVKDEESNGYTSSNFVTGSTEMGDTVQDALRNTGQRFSVTPYITPRLTPTGTPTVISTGGSPRGFSAAVSPRKTSGTTSPTKPNIEGRSVLSSWYPSSQQSSAASSPPHGRPMPARTPRIDGKEFFRQARSRLSYEQFGAFLANIKELNAHKQSREETLRKAEEIFGIDNKDLYLSFQGLLNRSMA